MRNILEFVVTLSCWSSATVLASYCYPDYCQNLTTLVPTPGFQCLLTPVLKGEECAKLKFQDSNHIPPKEDAANFSLVAYVRDFGNNMGKATAFNLSFTDIKFHRLITRYQNLLDEKLSACRHIELYGNQTHPAPTELYVSCPFSSESFELSPYKLEYLVTRENYVYSKQYVFTVPLHDFIGENVHVRHYTPFVYIDVSNASNVVLYIQPAPEIYNVTKYRVCSINNDTGIETFVGTLSLVNKQHIRYFFVAPSGSYYFKIAALHPECEQYGCANITTPVVTIDNVSHRLLIMIISTVWIPPVLLYAVYHFYKLYRKREAKKKAKRPNCLLVYSSTRLTHINVMIDLAKYLRGYNTNAMIDILDIADSNKDPATWCTDAFREADIILVAISPPAKEPIDSAIYQDVGTHMFRLLKENCAQSDKRYYTVQFPYCKTVDIFEEASNFKHFYLPKDLNKLVKAIQNEESVRHVSVSDKELLNSIRLATLEVFDAEVNSAKDTEETDGLLTTNVVETGKRKHKTKETKDAETEVPEGNSIPQSFATNIDELNLLGESGAGETQTFAYKTITSDRTFQIDELNL